MIKQVLLALLLIAYLGPIALAQQVIPVYMQQINRFQEELNAEYADTATSPLPKAQIAGFKGLPFFPIDSAYRLTATFVRTPGQLAFYMPTTTGNRKMYEKYGEVHFILHGKKQMLTVYQSHTLRETAAYKDYLFLPFTDLTNGHESYGSGRFMDLRIPEGDTITLDFNKAYNPYCAYSEGYNCPIPPRENRLKVAVRAGVKAPAQAH
ncbi:DUF1684 domain-containing protein [Pontibacter sp. E15-1]|uniref:DUF1684 domain-containing protein n=1 Tax=Pontibacter sp. E15-1 TaxID=2919918 RepID=UPI001F4F9216|nr:DUF1684 domain-containing protein [Pontibacter sp. E15-1]MCJ8164269.1 DUF1684 domain-containing protein [Pontibacter sp. E15-1]